MLRWSNVLQHGVRYSDLSTHQLILSSNRNVKLRNEMETLSKYLLLLSKWHLSLVRWQMSTYYFWQQVNTLSLQSRSLPCLAFKITVGI